MGQDKRRQEESPMEQRRNQIVELVNRKGSISFAQLKEAFLRFGNDPAHRPESTG